MKREVTEQARERRAGQRGTARKHRPIAAWPRLRRPRAGFSFSDKEALRMDIRNEIVTRLDRLPPEMQGQALRFVSSLTALPPKGESGTALREFSQKPVVLAGRLRAS